MVTVKLVPMPDGACAAYAVAEVYAVPYYELLNKDPVQAAASNRAFFTQYVSGLLRSSAPDLTAYEMIFQSVPVSDQTYAAQVRMYFVIRQYGRDPEQLRRAVAEAAAVFRNEMEQHHYAAEFLSENAEYVSFMQSLAGVSSTCAAAVVRRERSAGGVYYTPVLIPSEQSGMIELTNALTQYPGSLVSLQIIPTCYQDAERMLLLQCSQMLGFQIGEIRRMQGMMPPDAQTQAVADAYHYYAAAVTEPAALCNFIVYSDRSSITALCNKLIGVAEDASQSHVSALEMMHLPPGMVSPAARFHISPWTISSQLVGSMHDPQLSAELPQALLRLKYLMTQQELSTVFCFPMDNGSAIGLETQRVQANREKLSGSVLSEGNFKVGVIRSGNAGTSFREAHAGIPLDDFTKHGLIVGMPGMGKTNFSIGFLLRMWQQFHIPFIAIEPTKTEYRALLDVIPDLQIFTPGKSTVSPFIINPFIPPENVTVQSYTSSLTTAFNAAFSMPDPLPAIFRASINACYNEYGWRADSTRDDPLAKPFGMYEFIRVFKRRLASSGYAGDVKSNMTSAGAVRLLSLIETDPLIYDNIHTIPLEDLMRRPTVIELNAINGEEQKSLIMALLLTSVCVYIKTNLAGDGKLKNILLIDEAHVLLGGGGSAQEGSPDTQRTTIHAIENMIAEVRAYGFGIIIADQSPEIVGKNIVGNTNVKVMFKLAGQENRDILSNATNMTEAEQELLGRLDRGEALLHYGRVNEPLHIQTYLLSKLTEQLGVGEIRSVIPDSEVAASSRYWDTRQDMLIPHLECAYNCACKAGCDMRVRLEADFIATSLMTKFTDEIQTEQALRQRLAHLDQAIIDAEGKRHEVEPDLRFCNCVKIKFLRKALLEKAIDYSQQQYDTLLRHEKFLKREESSEHGGA